MSSFIPMGGFQLPFGRRLSRLYNDTKKSSDFVVKEPAVPSVESDPEIKALHRKLRIQKDRLTSWGLEWSDPNNQSSAEVFIDTSLSKAGLSELVDSILSTIKDILAEVEPLWHSSRRLAGERVEPEQPPRRGEKIQLVVWDKNRFEDLIRDLTTSIDTLYDLSRTRSSYAQSSAAARERMFKNTTPAEDLRPFESSRMQTPQVIDPSSLTNLSAFQAEPMTEPEAAERPREVVFMTKQAYADLTHTSSTGRQPYAPLLLEYAPFDSIYATTGIMPPMTRFEKLSAGLQTEPQRSPGSWTGLPHLLGYFEDMDHSRLGLVYQFPPTFNPVTFEHLTQNPLYNLCSLADLLARPDFEPKLEAKFRLAANLANTVFDMHARGITHGNFVDTNVSFCNAVGTDPEVSGMTTGEVDIRRPLVSAFDLFSEPDSEGESAPAPFSLYKHPLDPRVTAQSPLANHSDSKTFDLYSLAMVLLSIGLWTKLENLIPSPESPSIPESVLEQLAIRCGTLYMKAVQTCWNAVDQEMTGHATSEQIVARVQLKTSRYLEACCILDGVNKLEERLGDDLGEARAQSVVSPAGPSKDTKDEAKSEVAVTPLSPTPRAKFEDRPTSVSVVAPSEAPLETTQPPSAKSRLYPQVPLPPEAVDHWNSVLMPQVNSALKHFYRKNLESVEISLESIGESPQRTQPTVLVVCTSVSKVRSILKKKLGEIFDGTTGFALKVCRGQVLRSRNSGAASRSQAGQEGEEIAAANPGFQERPQNGASIGAWVGDRHLPPVSFGGLIVVDEKQYGMTVHHMLDDPAQDEDTATAQGQVSRSMAGPQDLASWYAQQYQQTESEADSSGSSDYACEFSDSDSDTSESAITSEASDDEEADDGGPTYDEAGDIPGIEPGCGDGYIVTQPALDDVPDGFYPSAETQDEDHLDTYTLGDVYASSGIRRRSDQNGLVHEIDWALFEFRGERQPHENWIPRAQAEATKRAGKRTSTALLSPIFEPAIHPTLVKPTTALAGLEVQCMARTSGLQTGLILPALTSVKIYGRKSPSHTYQVSRTTSPPSIEGQGEEESPKKTLPMGVPGDSGAWVVDKVQGQLCGHVLAWSQRKRVAYICPMEVLLVDIAETLEASEIRLPGGEALISIPGRYDDGKSSYRASNVSALTEDMEEVGSMRGWEGGDEFDEAPSRVPSYRRGGSRRSQRRSQLARQSITQEEDMYDEAVEVELENDLRKLELSERAVRSDRWGVSN